jgi:branched-chain amino acid transport system permease protein
VGLSVSIAGPYFGIGYGIKGLGVLVLGGSEVCLGPFWGA